MSAFVEAFERETQAAAADIWREAYGTEPPKPMTLALVEQALEEMGL